MVQPPLYIRSLIFPMFVGLSGLCCVYWFSYIMVPSQVRTSFWSLNTSWTPNYWSSSLAIYCYSRYMSCPFIFYRSDSVDYVYCLGILPNPLQPFSIRSGYSQHASLLWSLCNLELCHYWSLLVVYTGQMTFSSDIVAFQT